MGLLDKYQNGVNLGGWISQYPVFDYDYFNTFITEKDIQQIASWGMDHVRLPIDYPVLEDDDNPFVYKENGFAYIDNCVEWCRRNNLNVILDIHRTSGYDFNFHESSKIFTDSHHEERFLNLWRTFAKRYAGEGGNVLFELLNEVVDGTSDRWNRLAHKGIAVIRETAPERGIIYGGNFYNNVRTLKEIALVDDPNIAYTFHFYEPLLFTHQKAAWLPLCKDFDRTMEYPGEFAGLPEFIDGMESDKYFHNSTEHLRHLATMKNDKTLMMEYLQPAVDFISKTKLPLYCGEFGVIDRTPMQWRINWHRDFVNALRELGIARAVWTYKMLDFGLVDAEGKVFSEELVKAICGK